MKINEKTKEQLKEDLRKTREELAMQKWGLEKTLEGMRALVKDAEKAKAKEDAILSSIGDGMVATDKNARVIFMNKAMGELIGRHEEGVIGKSWFDMVPMEDDKGNSIPDDKRPIYAAISQRTTTTTTTTSNYYLVRRDKTKFPVAVTATPIILNGKVIGAIGIYRDITHELGIDKAKSEFVSLASHQLRTPLSTVNWYSEMLLAGDVGELNKEQKKYLDEVYRGNQRMVGLVNSLLNVSRLELGTFSVETIPTDITKIVKEVIEEQRPEIKKHTLVLKETYTAGLPKINADPKLLHMVFDNLLSNAIKYMPKKGKIDISIKKETDHILISIADTGMGIPKSQQDKIFTKFFRADNVREQDTEGTGLGLYIVKSIIEKSGGKIWFESLENKGTTFYIVLPLEGMRKKEGTKQLS